MAGIRKELSVLLQQKIETPHVDISESPVVSAVCRLLTANGVI
jgi:hypothetical protein